MITVEFPEAEVVVTKFIKYEHAARTLKALFRASLCAEVLALTMIRMPSHKIGRSDDKYNGDMFILFELSPTFSNK